jgi:RNA polymerase sigma-70 factor (ECF subfamily)
LNGSDGREEMVRTHLPQLLRLCTVILGNAQEAEDTVQEVFLKAFRSANGFRGDASLSTWLTRIAIHACRDQIRRKNRRREVWDEETEDVADPAPEPVDRLAAREMAMRALSTLSPKEEMVVRLRFGGDYRIREIADVLRCSESTAKTYLRRAMKKMAKTLNREERR